MQTEQELIKILDDKNLLKYSYELAEVIVSPDTNPSIRNRARRHYQLVADEYATRLRTF